jgi:hypothetical protein
MAARCVQLPGRPEIRAQAPGPGFQFPGRPERLGRHPGRQVGGTVVGVDQAVDVATQRQPEFEVLRDQVRGGLRDGKILAG